MILWGFFLMYRAGGSAGKESAHNAGDTGRSPGEENAYPLQYSGLSYVNWAIQECCLFYLRSSLRSTDLLLFHFHGLFPSLSCSHCHFGLLFPVLPT